MIYVSSNNKKKLGVGYSMISPPKHLGFTN